MANEIKYNSKEECLAAIETLKTIGMDPLPWQLEQLKAFEEAETKPTVVTNSETPIWETLKANYPYGIMPKEKIDCVEDSVRQLLEESPRAKEPGLLLGKIQCGKTDTFEDIIGLSFDKGVDIAIVLTKGTKALVNQTIKRMKKDFRFFKRSDDLSQRSIIDIHDIMSIWRSLKQSQVEGCKTVIVCKKNAANLNHLIEMFQSRPYLLKKKVLIVDDEADFASRNYRAVKLEPLTDEEGNPLVQTKEDELAKIARQIDDFRDIPSFCRYLQVTATPYSLYLQPEGELNLNGNSVNPFKPRFTSLVPIHDHYIGGEEYFIKSQDEESMYWHLYHQIDQRCVDVLGHEDKRYLNNSVSSSNIYGLTYAMTAYFVATAIRRIQMRETLNKDYKTSAVIHVEIDKKNHEWQRRMVNRLIDSIKKVIVDEDQTDQRIWTAFDEVYKDFEASNVKGRKQKLIKVSLPSIESVKAEMCSIFKHNYDVQIVNSDEQMEALLDEDSGELKLHAAANIFIGGNILDRGVTIQHMLCFFYGRNPKSFQQDTVLQHARMYGARSKEDMTVTRLHTTPQIYRILVRMNELDEQLRKWFIEGHDREEPNAIFVGYDKDIKPCATQKIKASNTITLKPQQRILPIGFWTGTKKAIGKTVEQIDKLITTSPHYSSQDENGFFEMDKKLVMEILRMIESTYEYDNDKDKHFNLDRKNDIMELLCALDYCTSQSDGKVYAIHRVNRDMTRVRENGSWIDAPDDGRTDTAPSKNKAIDRPVVMFLRQNGEKKMKEGVNIGWNNAPFYWPVLMTQQNIGTVMYALDQSKKKLSAAVDLTEFLTGIPREELLTLTYKGDLEAHFGAEGTEYIDLDDCPVETRMIKDTTAAKYLSRDESGCYLINPSIPFDRENDHGVYSANNGKFPFVLRPYKYMLLRNKRNENADFILLELMPNETWIVQAQPTFNDNGDLIDMETEDVLVRSSDTLIAKDLKTTEFRDETVTQWQIVYVIKKVLKFKKSAIHQEGKDE